MGSAMGERHSSLVKIFARKRTFFEELLAAGIELLCGVQSFLGVLHVQLRFLDVFRHSGLDAGCISRLRLLSARNHPQRTGQWKAPGLD